MAGLAIGGNGGNVGNGGNGRNIENGANIGNGGFCRNPFDNVGFGANHVGEGHNEMDGVDFSRNGRIKEIIRIGRGF